MDNTDLIALVTRIIAKAPDWLRHDLGVADVALRERAEETLAAMIGAAIGQQLSE